MTCENCGNPAADVYKARQRALHLCDRCIDRFDLQSAFEQTLPDLINLEESANWQAAIAAADAFLATYAARDHDHWLLRSVLAQKALILEGAGKLSEALELLRRVSSDGVLDRSDFLVNQLAMAKLLEKMQQPAEAIRVIEIGLDAATGNGVPTSLRLLENYARLASSIGINIPATYVLQVQQALEWWGIGIEVIPTDPSGLARVIFDAAEAERLAGGRFRELHERLRDLGSGPDASSLHRKLLLEYSSKETVGYYKKRALQLLGEPA